jgi:hypothetical protein
VSAGRTLQKDLPPESRSGPELGWLSLILRIYLHVSAQILVEQARKDTLVNPRKPLICRYNSGELLVVAIVDQLIQLFTRPRCGVLCPQVI